MPFFNSFCILKVFLFSLNAISQDDFNFERCTLYGDSISSVTARKHIQEGRPTLLVQQRCTSEKRARYIAQKYAEYLETHNKSTMHESINQNTAKV